MKKSPTKTPVGSPYCAYRVHERVTLVCDEPSRAKQSMSAECDINLIMDKYARDGLVQHLNTHQGSYGDLPGVIDYHDALNAVLSAKEAFDTLPSKIRSRFDNEPALFLSFVNDENNRDEMAELGLIEKTEIRKPDPEKIAENEAADLLDGLEVTETT